MLGWLNREPSFWPALQAHGAFCVNLLAADQSHVADRFAGRGGFKGLTRYEGASWPKGATGTLTLAAAVATIDCELEESIDRHSHSILIGVPKQIILNETSEPLLYWHGAYRLISNVDRVLTRA